MSKKTAEKTKKTTKTTTKAKTSKATKVVAAKTPKAAKPKATGPVNLPDDKQKLIELFAQKAGDTGSPEVQVALLSHKIDRLTSHLEENKKDNHSRRGLLKVIAKRRRILNYLQKLDEERYKHLIVKIGLKK